MIDNYIYLLQIWHGGASVAARNITEARADALVNGAKLGVKDYRIVRQHRYYRFGQPCLEERTLRGFRNGMTPKRFERLQSR